MKSNGRNKYFLFASLIFFISGFVLINEQQRLILVRYVNNFFGLSLDEHFRAIGVWYIATYLILFGSIFFLYFIHSINRLSQSRFYVISFSLLLIHYFYHLTANAINFPVYDDQGAILDFLVRYSDASAFSEKIKLLCAPYNESVIFLPKLFVLCCMKLFGGIDFKYLIIFNGILLLLFHFLLFRKTGTNLRGLPLFFIVSVFVFQFQYYDDTFWAISGLCYYGVFIFALLTFYFLKDKNSSRKYFSLIFSLLAALTFGNGWVLFPLSVCFLLFQKRYKEVFAWLLLFGTLFIFYYSGRSQFHALSIAHWNLLDNILFVLILLGSAFQFFYMAHIPVIIGLLIVSVFIFATVRKQYRTSPVCYLMLSFLIGSAIIASPFRSGMEAYGNYGLHVRYGIFSIYTFVLSVSLLLANTEIKKSILYSLFALAFFYNALTGIFFFPEVVIRREKLEEIVSDIKQNKFSVNYSTFRKGDVEMLLKEAIKKGIYKP